MLLRGLVQIRWIAGGEIVPKIEISLSKTVFELKEKIKKELDVEVNRQSLWYRDTELSDYQFIGNYGLRGNETLFLSVSRLPPHQKLHVLVKHIGSDGYVRVKETDKVSDLLTKVERYWAVPLDRISLYRHNVKLEHNLPLYSYYINEASEINLSVLIEPR
ncbi:hypothetical protein VNO77_16144 [Canavalia gladiata]|uniref:Ubiquitin-like domain-containing protein n=1 Tax=Canavalia gladiata TaxID=3824 RepID=A0AAN9M0M4_CANGL